MTIIGNKGYAGLNYQEGESLTEKKWAQLTHYTSFNLPKGSQKIALIPINSVLVLEPYSWCFYDCSFNTSL